jgi:hypothetical protein
MTISGWLAWRCAGSFNKVSVILTLDDGSSAAMSKLVRKTLADSPMTPSRKRKLVQLAAQPDSEINLSDIPPLQESFWKNAVRNPFYRPVKQQLTRAIRPD